MVDLVMICVDHCSAQTYTHAYIVHESPSHFQHLMFNCTPHIQLLLFLIDLVLVTPLYGNRSTLVSLVAIQLFAFLS